MNDTMQSKRRPGATDKQPEQMPAAAQAQEAPSDGALFGGERRSKLHAKDGLADHQRNPLAPPINITSNG